MNISLDTSMAIFYITGVVVLIAVALVVIASKKQAKPARRSFSEGGLPRYVLWIYSSKPHLIFR